MERIKARVLWTDHKYENGIVVDAYDREYYIDVSACQGRLLPLRGQIVEGFLNTEIPQTACLKDVRIIRRVN